jgi:hypothetical protein
VAGTFALRRTVGATRRGRIRLAAAIPARPRVEPEDSDRFVDIVVMISVVLFMLLFAGVGILVLQDSLH